MSFWRYRTVVWLSRIVARGVALLERQGKRDSAVHYLRAVLAVDLLSQPGCLLGSSSTAATTTAATPPTASVPRALAPLLDTTLQGHFWLRLVMNLQHLDRK
eukprot:CAMPEP_0118993000 /NCGR_PEP_ID=MMETSP1173-20130426/54256_1 /TAXON_ID=1034831 /ORGANISM="Rhizochromulina marina cf, Strain CCMP1243" /LENGTH=101 /DNA_ID=CAMNT_0006944223 /DNA_START=37 /DNA_END=339 /DNA_ORIENTATION=-